MAALGSIDTNGLLTDHVLRSKACTFETALDALLP